MCARPSSAWASTAWAATIAPHLQRSERGSWDFFDFLLKQAGVVCTPGAGLAAAAKPHPHQRLQQLRERAKAMQHHDAPK
jgi:aspartate/methionine/tyrosine aminotransferase